MITFCKYALCFAMFFKKNNIRRLQNQSFSWLLAIFLLLSSSLCYGQETSETQENDANKHKVRKIHIKRKIMIARQRKANNKKERKLQRNKNNIGDESEHDI